MRKKLNTIYYIIATAHKMLLFRTSFYPFPLIILLTSSSLSSNILVSAFSFSRPRIFQRILGREKKDAVSNGTKVSKLPPIDQKVDTMTSKISKLPPIDDEVRSVDDAMSSIFENNEIWRKKMKENDPEYFDKLGSGHKPEYMWIGKNQISSEVRRNVFRTMVVSDASFVCCIALT